MNRFFLFLSVTCTLVACTGEGGGEPSAASTGIELHRGNGADPGTMDPHLAEDDSATEVLRDLYEGLIGESVNSELEPAGAVSWQISDDGLEYVFQLQPEARWSNSDPVVAEDYVAGLRRTVDPSTASVYAQLLSPIVNATAITAGELPPETLGVEALDPHTLKITLASLTPYFLGLLTLSQTYPIHRPSLAEHGDQFTRPGNHVTNGPYKLEDFIAQAHIKLVKNEHYWNSDDVAIDTVYYYNTEDRSAEFKRYRAGELDYTYEIPNTQYKWIQENLPGELHTAPYLSTYYYAFNLHKPPFKDNVGLRMALSMAVDRETLVEKVTRIGEVTAYGFVPPGIVDYTSQSYEWADWPRDKVIGEAQRLYHEAGYSDENPLRVEILYNTSENHKRLAVAIAQMWKQTLGVEATLVNEEWKVFLQTRQKPDAWEIARFGWIGDYNDANTYAEIMHSTHGQNYIGFVDEEFDALVEAAAVETDLAKRREMLQQAERMILDGYPIIPFYFYVSKHLVKPHVKGFESNVMDRNQSRHYRIERPKG